MNKTVWIIERASQFGLNPDTFLVAVFLEKPTKENLKNLLFGEVGKKRRKAILDLGCDFDLADEYEEYYQLREVSVGDKGIDYGWN